ncbi:hypothetical protein XA68_15828 [Ophiocordyceps unilateralis]|uniref:Mid2 domain-containing protein n=1 Tax=Ophiocordyceps unilateralis TaxID=268505 RepID=A0A2A9P6C0_OPHUN|nr:hypothetical protein XA68_15828 [Ophiocordyceps unilateralis]
MIPSLLALLVLASPLSAAKQQCYHIDGTPSADSSQPCNPEAVFSPCCDTNKAKPDICLSSGLCYAQDSGFEGFIYSNGCTDPSGKADACPHVCPDRTNNWKGGPVIGSYNVLQCREGGHFCCRKAMDSENCCGVADAAVSVNIGQLRFPTSTATTTSTTTTPTSAVCHPDRAVSGEGCPKDNSAVVGGAVGGVLGAALLGSLGALAVMCLRRGRRSAEEQPAPSHSKRHGRRGDPARASQQAGSRDAWEPDERRWAGRLQG